MRPFMNSFLINAVTYTDLDADDTGRDEMGYMHRIVARYKVGTWPFMYSTLTAEEKRYMESLFEDAPDFEFTHPDRLDATKRVPPRAYRPTYKTPGLKAKLGLWKTYGFNIIEC